MKMYDDKEQLLKVMSFVKLENLNDVQKAKFAAILENLVANSENSNDLNLASATVEASENNFSIADGCYSDSSYILDFDCEYPFRPTYDATTEITNSNWFVEDNVKDTCNLEIKLVGSAEQIFGQLYIKASCTETKWCIVPTKFSSYDVERLIDVKAADIIDSTDIDALFADAPTKKEETHILSEVPFNYDDEEYTLSAAYDEKFLLPT